MNIGIIGLGLIGGSIGRILTKRTEHKVYAVDITQEVMLKGEMLDAYHELLSEENIKEIDVLIITTYPRTTIAILDRYASMLKEGAIVIDCGGVKRSVVQKMKELCEDYPQIAFLGGHPMAGREYSGIRHSSINLFDRASMLIMPVEADIQARATIKKLFFELGFARVVSTKADIHDKMIAYTSQLAHVVSSAYIKSPSAAKHYGYSAGSFRDLTRVAKLNPKMWTELLIDNRDMLIEEIEILEQNIKEYKEALKSKDEKKLELLLKEGNQIKELIEKEKSKSYENS